MMWRASGAPFLQIAMIIACICAQGCESDDSPIIGERTPLAVTGTVRDSITSVALPDVRITGDSNLLAVSDSLGRYNTVIGYELDHSLVFSKSGYHARAFHLTSAATQDSTVENLYHLDVLLPSLK